MNGDEDDNNDESLLIDESIEDADNSSLIDESVGDGIESDVDPTPRAIKDDVLPEHPVIYSHLQSPLLLLPPILFIKTQITKKHIKIRQ
jgi:hypothetical protein